MTHSASAQRWTFFAVVSTGLLMIGLDNSILYTALPALEHSLNTTPSQGLWIINAYPLVLSGLLLGTGALGDRVCLLYTSPSPRDRQKSRMPSSA